MANSSKSKKLFDRRKQRVRSKISKVKGERLRLSVYRSSTNIYVQLIDDNSSKTLASCSSIDKDFSLKSGGNIKAAEEVGKKIAERAIKLKVKDVIFDRGGYIYHGRIKALAEAARSAGLNF